MNDRIQELAEQAGYKHPDAVGMIEDYAYFDHEKFAKLIVKECIDWCNAYATINGTAQQIRDAIKNHFGVE